MKKIRVTVPEDIWRMMKNDIEDFKINNNKLCNYILEQLKYKKEIDIEKELEVLEDVPLPLLSMQIYGDSQYWDIIMFINGSEFDVLPNSTKFIYSELDRLKDKLYHIYKHNIGTTEQQMEQLAFDLLNKKNADRRKIKVLKEEYLGDLISKYREISSSASIFKTQSPVAFSIAIFLCFP